MTAQKPQLTISLLASNRPDTLRRCLDSLRGIMDVIPSELILIDTSKNPKVHEILLEYSDQVYEFEWCKDFAKARNEGLLRAKGEWFLYLDDDEWFVETDALIDFFQSGEYKRYGYANYKVRNFMDVKYTNYSDCWVSRMIRIDADTRFVSKIHEYFTPIRGARKDIEALAYHSGYIYETPEKRRAHFERNASLLREMIEEEPENIRWQTQLVQEYTSMGEWERLESYCKERLEATINLDGAYESIHIGTFHAGYVYGLLYQNKYEACIKACAYALEDKRTTDVLRALLYLKESESYLGLEKWDDALEYVQKYLHALKTINQAEAHIKEQKLALVAGEAFDESKQKDAYSILICSQLEKGSTDALRKYYDKLGWNQPVIYVLDDVEKYMVKTMWNLPYELIFTRIVVDAFQNRELRVLFVRAIVEQKSVSNNADVSTNDFRQKLIAFVKALQAVLEGPKFWDSISYYNVLGQYVQATADWMDFVQAANIDNKNHWETDYVEAAVKISEYVQLETQDKVQALGKLKEAVDIFPEFADGIGQFLHAYGELEKQRAQKQKKEMDALRVQVIAQIKAMLASGQRESAISIIAQLKQMFPEDLEVAALALEVYVEKT